MPTVSGVVVPTGGQTAYRRTFNDVIDELARPVDSSATNVRALAADAFRSAVRRINGKGSWPWEIQDEDISVTANNAYSTATSAIKKPLAMHFLESSGGTRDQRISYLPYDQFIEKYDLNVSSEPHTYTIPNLFETGQIRWFPTPSSNDNARFTYYRVTPAPRDINEAIEIPEYIMEFYTQVAWAELMKRLPSEQRPVAITIAINEARMAFRELSAHVNSTGDRWRRASGGYNLG